MSPSDMNDARREARLDLEWKPFYFIWKMDGRLRQSIPRESDWEAFHKKCIDLADKHADKLKLVRNEIVARKDVREYSERLLTDMHYFLPQFAFQQISRISYCLMRYTTFKLIDRHKKGVWLDGMESALRYGDSASWGGIMENYMSTKYWSMHELENEARGEQESLKVFRRKINHRLDNAINFILGN